MHIGLHEAHAQHAAVRPVTVKQQLMLSQHSPPSPAGLLLSSAPQHLASSGQAAADRWCAAQIREAAEELGYQADEMFCLKISQLREIFVVRWSVFLLGPAGCGKTAIWKTLLRAQQIFGEKSSFKPINPKVGPGL